MGKRINLNFDWVFNKKEKVNIPHTPSIIDYNYFNADVFEEDMVYEKEINIPNEYEGSVLRIYFEGIAHYSKIILNSKVVHENFGGYSGFSVDITDVVLFGQKNKLKVIVSAKNDLNFPPFGGVIDYITYGGIYREVYLHVLNKYHIKDVFCYSEIADKTFFLSDIKLSGVKENLTLEILQNNALIELVDVKHDLLHIRKLVDGIELWDTYNPKLYELTFRLYDSNTLVDEKKVMFGYRRAEFKSDGFYLNDKKIDLIGLNRHQSFAYYGYAMPRRVQENDAIILKEELKVNIVRTSHYPQSRHFYNKCDELGLLVFTEIPGWQHVGDDNWKEKSMEQLKAMILEHRNHPSIVVWGVRINESLDFNEFYVKTNAISKELDPTRQTTGVRYLKNSNLLEDVYSLNDFVNDGSGVIISNKSDVTDMIHPYLITEHSGHMYPVKTYDNYMTRLEQAKRHSDVIRSVIKTEGISGTIGWCMNDYNTNLEFGSGDGICHHGVLDMFRNPKMAASVYKSYGKESFLDITSNFHMGDTAGGIYSKVYAITNLDRVDFYKDDKFIKSFKNDDNFIHIDDFIGDGIEDAGLKKVINYMSMYTPGNMPSDIIDIKNKLKESDDELYSKYNKYIGGWGSENKTYRFVGIKNGEEVAKKCFDKNIETVLNVKVDSNVLLEQETYDVASIRITIEDQYGNRLHYFDDIITFEVEGALELIGPSITHFRGGATGTYVRTKGVSGKAKLIVKCRDMVEVLEFEIIKK